MQSRSKDDLRRVAMSHLPAKLRADPGPRAELHDLQALVQELQIHQIELEMQNEELRHAKDEIEEGRNKYLELFDSAPVGYVTLDHLGRIQEANLTLAAFLDRPREFLLQQPFSRYLSPGARASFGSFCRKVAATATPQTCQLHLVCKDETHLEVQVKGLSAPCPPSGLKHGQLRLVLADMTAQRQAEREQEAFKHKLEETQKLESLGVLAGGVAHDFNNLLTGILGNACLARNEAPEDSSVRPQLERIIAAAGRAAELCKQMLDYSGKGRLVVEPTNLNTLIRETVSLLQLSISKNVRLLTRLTEPLPDIAGGPTQLRQVVMNLVINASEALGERNGTIAIATSVRHVDRATLQQTRLSPDLPAGRYVQLELSDDGCGMDEATLARIFDPFYSTKFAGRGLGLAAVLGIVRGHGGAINVTSGLSQGTTFTLLFPALDTTRALRQPKAGDESAGPKWRGTGTILVADDEEAVRSVTARMLKSFGFEVVLAANGQECLEQFRPAPGRFTAVLLDLTMPHLSGLDTLHELRRIHPGTSVLLMSGFNEENVHLRAGMDSPNGFLQKPFKPEDLRESLRSILGHPALPLPPVDRTPEPGRSDPMPGPFLHLP